MVISMITVITALFAVDFRSARSRQHQQVLAEQSIAILQQSRAEVRAGVQECRGLRAEEGEAPQVSVMPFGGGTCDRSSVQQLDYGLSEIGGVDALTLPGPLDIVFRPPNADLIVYSQSGEVQQNVDIVFGNHRVRVEDSGAQITLISGNEE